MGSISEAIREWFFFPILHELKKMEAQMAQDQAALDTALTALGMSVTSLAALVNTVVAEVAALIAKIQANPGVDFTNEITALNSMAANIGTDAAAIQAAIDTAKPVTGQ